MVLETIGSAVLVVVRKLSNLYIGRMLHLWEFPDCSLIVTVSTFWEFSRSRSAI